MSPIKVDESAKPARVLEFPELPISTQDPASYEEFIASQAAQHAREEARAQAEKEREHLQYLVTGVVHNPTVYHWWYALLSYCGVEKAEKLAEVAVTNNGKNFK
jgi:hypothetical protein